VIRSIIALSQSCHPHCSQNCQTYYLQVIKMLWDVALGPIVLHSDHCVLNCRYIWHSMSLKVYVDNCFKKFWAIEMQVLSPKKSARQLQCTCLILAFNVAREEQNLTSIHNLVIELSSIDTSFKLPQYNILELILICNELTPCT
jgi:hypothetical protein